MTTECQPFGRKPRRYLRSIEERLAYYTDASEGPDACWPWRGTLNRSGYGDICTRASRHGSAHREAWKIQHGEIPAGLSICHHCDNPSCVNPSHLFLCSQADNVADMISKGRDRRGSGVGVANGRAKLDDDKVRQIRLELAQGATRASISRRFALGSATVSKIALGQTWRHIPSSPIQWEPYGRGKLSALDIQIIRVLAGIGCTHREIAVRYGVSSTTVGDIARRAERWRHIPDFDRPNLADLAIEEVLLALEALK